MPFPAFLNLKVLILCHNNREVNTDVNKDAA